MTRDDGAVLRAALAEAGLAAPVAARWPLAGGCIHEVEALTLEDGTRVVAKLDEPARLPVLEAEAAGLRALAATETVLVPAPLAVGAHAGRAVLVMTMIDAAPARDGAWARLGGELAALHRAPRERRYGFDADNFIGPTPQANGWMDDWVEFTRVRRLAPQVARARDAGRLDAGEVAALDRAMDALDGVLPRHPAPALLHGDLWSGNALPAGERVAVLDPACSIGDGWADVAMMRLFGGFDPACERAYAEAVGPLDADDLERRVACYQLYHVLNHVNIFGRGYAPQAVRLARKLG